jgi:hypothetical protein
LIFGSQAVHEQRLLQAVAPPKPPPPKALVGAQAAALQTGKADTKVNASVCLFDIVFFFPVRVCN